MQTSLDAYLFLSFVPINFWFITLFSQNAQVYTVYTLFRSTEQKADNLRMVQSFHWRPQLQHQQLESLAPLAKVLLEVQLSEK